MEEILIPREENIKTSSVYIGYLVLKKLKAKPENKITIFDITSEVKKELKIIHYRQVVFSLMFLYSCGLINFSAPYIYKT